MAYTAIKWCDVDCSSKKRYSTEKIAKDYADFYNKNPLIKEKDFISPYSCKIHDGWHVGHPKQPEDLNPAERLNALLDQIRTNK